MAFLYQEENENRVRFSGGQQQRGGAGRSRARLAGLVHLWVDCAEAERDVPVLAALRLGGRRGVDLRARAHVDEELLLGGRVRRLDDERRLGDDELRPLAVELLRAALLLELTQVGLVLGAVLGVGHLFGVLGEELHELLVLERLEEKAGTLKGEARAPRP